MTNQRMRGRELAHAQKLFLTIYFNKTCFLGHYTFQPLLCLASYLPFLSLLGNLPECQQILTLFKKETSD